MAASGGSPLADLYVGYPHLVDQTASIAAARRLLNEVLVDDHLVLVCGNGGSAADSGHIAAELVKQCVQPRPISGAQREALARAGDDGYLARQLQVGFRVFSLVGQPPVMTAIANDQGGDLIFAQQVQAYGRPGDLLWVLSTSGRSRNVVLAMRTARALGLRTLAMTGPDSADLSDLADVIVTAPGGNTPEIQHAHLLIYHALCMDVEAEWCST